MSVARFDLAEAQTTVSRVLDGCRSIGLFATRQAVLVRGSETLAKQKDEHGLITSYAESPDPSTTLIFVATKLNRSLGLVKKIGKCGQELVYDSPKSYELPRWVVGEARRLGHSVDQATAALIVDLAGHKLGLLQLVVDQLSLFVGPGAPITRDAVTTVLVATREHSVFELVDAVGERKDRPSDHAPSRHARPQGAAAPDLSMLATLPTALAGQGAESRGQSVQAIQKDLSLHQFVAKKLYAQSNHFDAVMLRRTYDRLYRTNIQLKSRGI